jgi:invasion protein IalB
MTTAFQRIHERVNHLLAVLALVVATALGSSDVSAQGQVKNNFADWELRCDTPAGRAEQCILFQNIADEAQPDINLVVVVLRVSESQRTDGTPSGRRPVLRVIAPLGVLLPSGLGLKIESAREKTPQGQPVVKDIGSTGFVKCLPNGCIAEVEMDDRLVGEFKAGKTATFIIFQTPAEGRGLPLNLAGFEEGFQALK